MIYIFIALTVLLTNFSYANDRFFSDDKEENPSAFFGSDTIDSSTGTYTLIKKLGEGAFGKVFKVQNTEDQVFAIKAYKNPIASERSRSSWRDNSSYSSSSQFDAYLDLEREYERGQILNHPHIIHSVEQFYYYNTSENQEIKCLVLEYVDGKTIGNIEKKSLQKEVGILATTQLMEALHYAHELGYFHMDLHSHNAMLTNENEFKVIDLASFFQIQELISASAEYSFYPYRDNSSDSPTLWGWSRSSRDYFVNNLSTMNLAQQASKYQSTPRRDKDKLKQKRFRGLFEQNPDLLNEIRRAKVEMEARRQATRTRSTSAKGLFNQQVLDRDFFEKFLPSINGYYLDSITDMCCEILRKVNMSAKERYDIQGEMMKIVWEYRDDLEEGVAQPINVYFQRIEEILHTSL